MMPLMTCPTCQHTNPDGARFCSECGASLAREAWCATCGRANSAGAKFCNDCGARLGAGTQAQAPAPRDYTPPHLAAKILQTERAAATLRLRTAGA